MTNLENVLGELSDLVFAVRQRADELDRYIMLARGNPDVQIPPGIAIGPGKIEEFPTTPAPVDRIADEIKNGSLVLVVVDLMPKPGFLRKWWRVTSLGSNMANLESLDSKADKRTLFDPAKNIYIVQIFRVLEPAR